MSNVPYRQHEFPNDALRCQWCGVKKEYFEKSPDGYTCLAREAPRPEPRRRISALDDIEVISGRIKELDKETLEWLGRPNAF